MSDTPQEPKQGKVEHWQGHVAVPRPPEPRPSPWPGVLLVAGAPVLGAAVLGLLDLAAHRLLTGGVTVIALGGLTLGIGLLSPLPVSRGFSRSRRFRAYPAPLVAPGLVFIGFALPSLVFIVIQLALGR